nr:hypothetical protein [Anaerolineae bacterium]
MKKRHLLPVSIVFLALSIIIAGSVVTLARNQRQPETPLARWVLQRSELPKNSEAYYAEQVTDDRFPGPLSPVNIPLQVEGFLEAYEMSAWYPCVFRGEAAKELVKDGQGGAFVLNLVYRYRDSGQARAALERQLKFVQQQDVPVDVKVESADYDESLTAANDVYGRAIRITYPSEGITWVTCYFFGVKRNILMLLIVDGLPDPATQDVFDTLVTKIVQR